ncbi:MAG TPA: type II secretion system protein N [Allosphingosinicella sp.]|jgi:general secretion pathway protein N
MRVRLPIGRTLFFLGAFFLALLALLPMRMAMDWFGLGARGVAAREVEGSVWFGALKEAQVGTIGLGDLHAGLRGLPLLIGRARIALDRDEGTPADELQGAATITRNSFGFDDVSGRLQLTAGALGSLPLSQIELGDFSARFENGLCVEATGTVRAAVAGDLAGIALPGGLAGAARCDAGALLLALAGQSGMETLELRLFGDGRYRASVLIRSTDATLRDRMLASGLTVTAQGYGLSVDGRF